MKPRAPLALAAAFALSLFVCAGARAQSARDDDREAPKVEVGAQFSSISLTSPEWFIGTQKRAGFGGRVTYNLTDYFALEAEGNFHPHELPSGVSEGGRLAQAQFGVKAGKRFRRWGVFGKVRPGVVSFGRVASFDPARRDVEGRALAAFGRKTYFSTDVGAVVEFYPSRRVAVRFDAGDTIIRYPERTALGPFGFPIVQFLTLPAETKHNFRFTAGVGFRF